jgi:hypothetical protein
MTPSLIIQVADAVVADLNASEAATSVPFKAVRHYRPEFELAELKTPRISVVPRGINITPASRSQNSHEVEIDVAIQQRVQAGDTETIDALMNLVQTIADGLRQRRLTAMPEALWIGTRNVPIYSPDHLETKGVFTGVLTLTFAVEQ